MATSTSSSSWSPKATIPRTAEMQYNLDLEAQKNAHSLQLIRVRGAVTSAAEVKRLLLSWVILLTKLFFMAGTVYLLFASRQQTNNTLQSTSFPPPTIATEVRESIIQDIFPLLVQAPPTKMGITLTQTPIAIPDRTVMIQTT